MKSIARTKRVAAALLAVLIAGPVAGQEGPGRAAPKSAKPGGIDVGRLPGEARRVFQYVTKPTPGELRWQEIPWLVDLDEGLRRAKAEGRPLLLFVSGDEPLGRC